MAKLTAQRYGKGRVRVLKILRDGATHTVKEIDVSVLLAGDFESSYTSGDNTKVVPTDTVKNTINVLAKQQLGDQIEDFAVILGEHFLNRYKQIKSVEIQINERLWNRMQIEGQPHAHSFAAGGDTRKFTHVFCTSGQHVLHSGIRNLVILKSTGSGFENYPKCEFTIVPETDDRILATSFSSKWTYSKGPQSYASANTAILDAMLKVFAQNYSPSAQTTVFQMGEAALEVCPEISQIELAMPNKHYLLINLTPFGLQNDNEVFVPTDEPHGQIEATVARDD
jgi:urate oxidase